MIIEYYSLLNYKTLMTIYKIIILCYNIILVMVNILFLYNGRSRKMNNTFLGEFKVENYESICMIENVISENTNILENKLSIKSNPNSKYILGYHYSEGLKRIAFNDKKNNPLGEFLEIKKEDLNTIKSFIEKYGFIVPHDSTAFTRVNIEDLFAIKNRLLEFINIINGQNSSVLNKKELIYSVLYLLLVHHDVDDNSLLSEYIYYPSTLNEILNSSLPKDFSNFVEYKKNEAGQEVGYISRYSNSLRENIELELEFNNKCVK